jgi:glycosyltransferase domain-containing protein
MEELTLLMTSFDRPGLLSRAIAHAEEIGVHLIVLDGSMDPSVDPLHVSSTIRYIHRPKVSQLERTIEGAHLVRTPFVALVADDNFALKRGLVDCVDFLRSNPSYVACQGARRIAFGPNVYGGVGAYSTEGYFYSPLEAPQGLQRVDALLNKYQPISTYAVHRTGSFVRSVMDAAQVDSQFRPRVYGRFELVFESSSCFRGKVGVVPSVVVMHSWEDDRTSGDLLKSNKDFSDGAAIWFTDWFARSDNQQTVSEFSESFGAVLSRGDCDRDGVLSAVRVVDREECAGALRDALLRYAMRQSVRIDARSTLSARAKTGLTEMVRASVNYIDSKTSHAATRAIGRIVPNAHRYRMNDLSRPLSVVAEEVRRSGYRIDLEEISAVELSITECWSRSISQ